MPIDHINLAGVDLNLLVALDALLTERSVTKAAARIGIGQSAMSHNLARLRDLFGDELMTRGAEGMRPTPRALRARRSGAHRAGTDRGACLARADVRPAHGRARVSHRLAGQRRDFRSVRLYSPTCASTRRASAFAFMRPRVRGCSMTSTPTASISALASGHLPVAKCITRGAC